MGAAEPFLRPVEEFRDLVKLLPGLRQGQLAPVLGLEVSLLFEIFHEVLAVEEDQGIVIHP